MSDFDPSPTLEAFLWAEIRNEDDGGISPTTLESALDSLEQMPDDVLEELNVDIQASGVDGDALRTELVGLIERLGPDFAVEPHMPDSPARRY